MRWFFFCFFSVIPFLPAIHADENVAQEFSGTGSTTTPMFKAQGRWEVRWNARQVVSVAVLNSDGTIVAGAAGVLRGSLFVPLGGQYYLKVSDGTIAPPAGTNAAPVPAPPPPGTNAPPVSPPPGPATNPPSPPTEPTPEPAPETAVSWHLQIVELGKDVPSTAALSVYTPFFMVPDSAVTPVTLVPPPPPPTLTDRQLHTLVTIKGDNASGHGFLMKSPDGIFVVTSLHLLAANPNVKIFSSDGAEITPLALKGAVDRDLALFTVQDNHYSHLALDEAGNVKTGDQVIIPDLSQRDNALTGKVGLVVGVSAKQVDFDCRIGPNGEGAPVIQVKTGNALALLTAAKRLDISETIAQAWPANPAPGSAGIFPYFGLRLTDLKGSETYDLGRFLSETTFLRQFHLDTRCLDTYLNSHYRRSLEEAERDPVPSGAFYRNNLKLRAAVETYKRYSVGADESQRMDSAHELLFDLMGVADTDVDTLQGWGNLYTYDQTWAREELAYRKALKKELEDYGNNLVRFDNLARTR